MVSLLTDGFDKYGPTGTVSPAVTTLLTQGEWTSTTGSAFTIVAPLSTTGNALNINASNQGYIQKTLAGNYSRLIGGFRFQTTLASNTYTVGIVLLDGANLQCSAGIDTSGHPTIRAGNLSASAVGTSGSSVSTNSIHHLGFDITFGTSAAYQLWLDGVSVLGGTGTTRNGSSNNYANAISIGVVGAFATGLITFDDFYLFDTSGSTNNAQLTTNPRIETQYPTSDNQTQWTNTAEIIGVDFSTTATTYSPGANQIMLRPFTPAVTMTLNSI